jgi:cbb3-type cytochrome oxidase maturation protein
MSVIYIIFPVALLLGFGAILAFSWAMNAGQMDDLDTPPVRILFDDEGQANNSEEEDLNNGLRKII